MPFDPSDRGRWRNRGGYRVSDWLMRGVGDVIERHAREFGLPPRRRAEECLSPLAQVAQCVRNIDFPRTELPDKFHYLGPFREEEEAGSIDLPEDGRPLVFCSFGTLQGSRSKLFHNAAAACASLGLRLLIAHGGRLPASARNPPGDAIVRDYVPQRAVLRRASLAITHAGFNTVLDALAAGVPMVAIPLAFEQPATASRLERAGVAQVVRPRRASMAGLRKAIAAVLEEQSYRDRAVAIQVEIVGAGGVRRAADIAEMALA